MNTETPQRSRPAKAALHALSTMDFVLRLAFFALAPVLLLVTSMIAPVTAIMVNLALTLLVFFMAEFLRTRFDRGSPIRRLLKRHLALAEYYRTRPPRPFIYYLLFPLMAPYWLISGDARHEFRLYRRYVFASTGLLLLLLYIEYRTAWAPEIAWKPFVESSIIVFVAQIVFVMAFTVPTAVTVIDCRHRKKTKRLLAFTAAFAVSSVLVAIAYFSQPAGTLVSIPTCVRMRERSLATPERAREVQDAALDVAELHLDEGKREKRRSGEEITGPPLDLARGKLRELYRPDETLCFRLFALPDEEAIVLRAETHKRNMGPIWLAQKAGRKATRVMDDDEVLSVGSDVIRDLTKKR